MAPNINFVPITLVPLPPPVGLETANFTQLLTAISQYLSASIQTNVSFFQTFSNPPGYFAGSLIFVTGLSNFMTWNNGTGQYDVLNQLQIGNVIQQSVHYGDTTFDDTVNGWIYLNGRETSGILGLSASQTDALNALYPSGKLPNVQPMQIFPVDIMAIAGAITSGTGFADLELVTQAVTGATAMSYLAQGTGIGNLVIISYTGTANASDLWTGTSGTIFTPNTIPYRYFGEYPIVSRVYIGSNIAAI